VSVLVGAMVGYLVFNVDALSIWYFTVRNHKNWRKEGRSNRREPLRRSPPSAGGVDHQPDRQYQNNDEPSRDGQIIRRLAERSFASGGRG